MKKFILIVSLMMSLTDIYPQTSGEKYSSKNGGEYLNFINDSIVEFTITRAPRGFLATLCCGYGIYEFKDSCLTIKIIKLPDGLIVNNLDTTNCKIVTQGVDRYSFNIKENSSMLLTGPILDNYKRLNKKRFFSGFLQLPWRWSFNKQHFFDPRQRTLYK